MRYCLAFLAVVLGITACSPNTTVTPTVTPQPLAKELVWYNWDGAASQSIMDEFEAEYGVKIHFEPYINQEEAIANMQAGKVYDVVHLYSDYTGQMLEENRLAQVDLKNIPNFINVSVNFRDLAFDPGNLHSIPYSWGTAGVVYRADLFGHEATHWDDIWQGEIGKIGIWTEQRTMIGMALRSLGYSANTDKPEELNAALAKLIELKAKGIFMEQFDSWTCAPELANGRISIALGWAADALEGRALNDQIKYILPEEGALLWIENMVIPANSPNKYTAELFINFMLRPEIVARYITQTQYAIANDPALKLLAPEIANDPVIFPPAETLKNAEPILPLSAQTRALYADIWAQFMAAPGGGA